MAKDPYLERYEKAFERTKEEVSGQNRRWSGITCPEQYDKTCVLCQLAWKVIRKKNEVSPELYDYAWDLNQKTKVYMNVVRKEDPKKVVVLECGKKILGPLMSVQMEEPAPAQKNFFSFTKGRNVTISKRGSARNTEYTVRFEDPSRFPESFLKQAYDLENIVKLKAEGKVPIIRAAQLNEGPNEMRILPNWRLGEEAPLFFYSIKYHTGLTESEFKAVQKGELDPFTAALLPEDHPGDSDEEDVPFFGGEPVGGEPTEEPVGPDESPFGGAEVASQDDLGFPDVDSPKEEEPPRDRCFGNPADYDPEDDECSKECPNFVACGEAVAAATRAKRSKRGRK